MTAITPFAADLIGFAGSFFIVAAYAYSNVAKAMDFYAAIGKKPPEGTVSDAA